MKRLFYSLLALLIVVGCARTISDLILKVGNGTDADVKIEMELGKGVSNPYLNYDTTNDKFQFCNEGSSCEDMGSGSGGGVPLLAKGSLLTSNGTANGEFTACADDEIIVYDAAESNGFKCEAKPVDTDTNAGTLCNAGEYLDGDGTCQAVPSGGSTPPGLIASVSSISLTSTSGAPQNILVTSIAGVKPNTYYRVEVIGDAAASLSGSGANAAECTGYNVQVGYRITATSTGGDNLFGGGNKFIDWGQRTMPYFRSSFGNTRCNANFTSGISNSFYILNDADTTLNINIVFTSTNSNSSSGGYTILTDSSTFFGDVLVTEMY